MTRQVSTYRAEDSHPEERKGHFLDHCPFFEAGQDSHDEQKAPDDAKAFKRAKLMEREGKQLISCDDLALLLAYPKSSRRGKLYTFVANQRYRERD
jgi:hypothetical protein